MFDFFTKGWISQDLGGGGWGPKVRQHYFEFNYTIMDGLRYLLLISLQNFTRTVLNSYSVPTDGIEL